MSDHRKLQLASENGAAYSPEENLCMALLERAMLDIRQTHDEEVMLCAKRWFGGISMRPFSFRWVCQALDIRPDVVLSMVERIKRGESRKPAAGRKAPIVTKRKAPGCPRVDMKADEILALHKKGSSIFEIAEATNLSSNSIKKFLLQRKLS